MWLSCWFNINLFLLGLTSGLIMDSETAFGLMLLISTLILLPIYGKDLRLKNYAMFLLGLTLVLLPRIMFEIKNDFLMTKSTINWLVNPKIYQEELTPLT